MQCVDVECARRRTRNNDDRDEDVDDEDGCDDRGGDVGRCPNRQRCASLQAHARIALVDCLWTPSHPCRRHRRRRCRLTANLLPFRPLENHPFYIQTVSYPNLIPDDRYPIHKKHWYPCTTVTSAPRDDLASRSDRVYSGSRQTFTWLHFGRK